MPDLFRLPEMPKHQGEIPLYRTPRPQIDQKLVTGLMERFGVTGKPVDAGSRILVRSRSAVLEVFEASGSIWWTKASQAKTEPMTSIKFPDKERSVALADSYLKQMNLFDDRARPLSVTTSELLWEKDGDKEPARALVNQHVNYEFTLEGLPVWGSGAKIQVTFGARNQVVEALKFWRETKQERNRLQLVEPAQALKIFMSDEAFTDLKPETASVKVDDMAVGYYALPPREVQGYLLPVYRLQGVVSTKELDRYEFEKYVVAVEFTPEQIKEMGATVAEGGPVL